MAVFHKPSTELAGIGTLHYLSGYWTAPLVLAPFGPAPFELILRAGRSGPSPAQSAALQRVVADAAALRSAASAAMAELHREGGLWPGSASGDAPEQTWQWLEPMQIEVSDSYFDDGRCAVLLIFASRLQADFAPAIETADGAFVQVLGGT